jgi:hypothetical protein
VLYEDDGKSLDYLQDRATWTRIRWNDRAQTLTIEPDGRSKTQPGPRRFEVLLVKGGGRKSVEYSGRKTELRF